MIGYYLKWRNWLKMLSKLPTCPWTRRGRRIIFNFLEWILWLISIIDPGSSKSIPIPAWSWVVPSLLNLYPTSSKIPLSKNDINLEFALTLSSLLPKNGQQAKKTSYLTTPSRITNSNWYSTKVSKDNSYNDSSEEITCWVRT